MSLEEILVIAMFATFIGLLFTGFPVAWVLAGTAIVFAVVGHVMVEYFDADLWYEWGSSIALFPERLWDPVSSDTLLALPMFIFMGIMLDRSGVAESLMKNMVRLFGGIRGGYAVTVIVIGVLLAATTGIIGASVVLLGMLSLPVMMEAKYSKSLAVGTACATGTLGILIPPSIMLVIMAAQLNNPNASVGDLFMGALFPGLLLGVLYISYVLILAFVNKKAAPVPPNVEKPEFTAKGLGITAALLVGVVLVNVFVSGTPIIIFNVLVVLALLAWAYQKRRENFAASVTWAVAPTAFLILAVLGSIFAGIATPTEASGVGALGATILAIVNRRLNFAVMRDSLRQTTRTSAFIFAIFLGATAFSVVLRGMGGDQVIEETLTGLPFGDHGILLTILLVTFLLGFFLDWVEITLIILPLVAPVVLGLELGVPSDAVLVWFTMMFAVCLQTSFLTPPVGFALFYIKGVCPPEITVKDIYKGVVPFIILQLIGLAVVYFYHPIVTWLPKVAYS